MKNEFLIPKSEGKLRAMILFGPPGSGKGTLGKMLYQAGNHYHLSSGDIFRSLDPDSPAGKLFHSYAGKGHLVPDEVTVQILKHYIEGLIATNRYFPQKQLLLLDGVPRTLRQAAMLDSYLDVTQLIVLDIKNLEGLNQRMHRRAIIEDRPDDQSVEILRTRMQVYEKETLALLKHYPEDMISHFNADQRPIEVLRDVLVSLSPLLT